MNILAIDPGPEESAWVLIDAETCKPIRFAKQPNHTVRSEIMGMAADGEIGYAVIEMVASYGMPVGAEVFTTCVWIGMFCELTMSETNGTVALTTRRPVKLHHCGVANAKDSNIAQALIDRFGAGASNRGKGTKAAPGWFYGFKADVWQAYALAVYSADTLPLEADDAETPEPPRQPACQTCWLEHPEGACDR